MEFVFIFAVIRPEVFFGNLLKIVEIVRAFRIDTLMEDEVFPLFFRHKRVAAMGTLEDKLL